MPTEPALVAGGVWIVDKPEGPTSHDLVIAARRFLGTRRVGHAGTLDPMATGVLVLMWGEATKLGPYLTSAIKRYRARVSFGSSTSTGDREGETIEAENLPPGWLAEPKLEAALERERQREEQVPPIFSAIKHGGVPAHKMARRGAPVELAPRPIAVSSLRLLEANDATALVELTVSKGYYVRSFARDLGRHLGVPSHLTELRRLASGPFSDSEAQSWPWEPPIRSLSVAEAARRTLPGLELTELGILRARQGKPLTAEDFLVPPELAPGTASAWFGRDSLVAIGQLDGSHFRVLRGFSSPIAALDP